MVKLTGINKGGPDSWGYGAPVFIHPAHVIGIEERQHSWHSFRPSQIYSTVYLSTGATIDVFHGAEDVQRRIDEAGVTTEANEQEHL